MEEMALLLLRSMRSLKHEIVLVGVHSIVVSIPACHAGNPGSIPGNGAKMLGRNIVV